MIEFKTLVPELLTEMPIIKASEYRYDWYSKAIEYMKGSSEHKPYTAKCPGIIKINSEGWIQRLSQDLLIKTKKDSLQFLWKVPEDQKIYDTVLRVHYHGYEQLAQFKNLGPNTFQTVLNIQSPWIVDIPEGYFLLQMPIPYSDDTRFTAAHGILRGPNYLNVPLFWHCLDSEERLKKGTPLCQYILVREEYNDHKLSLATQEDRDRILESLKHRLFEK